MEVQLLLVGGFIAVVSTLFTTIVKEYVDRKRIKLTWDREERKTQLGRVEDYVLKQVSMAKSMSKPIEHFESLGERFRDELINSGGESVRIKGIARNYGDEELAQKINELEVKFQFIWTTQMETTGVLSLDDENQIIEELGEAIFRLLDNIKKN